MILENILVFVGRNQISQNSVLALILSFCLVDNREKSQEYSDNHFVRDNNELLNKNNLQLFSFLLNYIFMSSIFLKNHEIYLCSPPGC